MRKKGFIAPVLLLFIFLILAFGYFIFRSLKKNDSLPRDVADSVVSLPLDAQDDEISKQDVPLVSIVAQGLEVPWALAFLPEGGMLVTEREGSVRLVNGDGELLPDPVAEIQSVKQIGEGGLHGITLHPDYPRKKFVYLYYTYSGSENETLNRVVRFFFDGKNLTDQRVIVDGIPGASNHDGGRIKFGPDGMLYITTGDAQNPSLAQNTGSLAGKILRVTDSGDPAPGNPFANRVYSYGHRNPQGIVWDAQGNLWSTEHGPSGIWPNCCQDEFNSIEIAKNYGWPDSVGDKVNDGTIAPILHSGRDIWAPAGLAYLNGKYYFTGLRGSALYEVSVVNGSPTIKTHFKNELGRLREVVAGPDGMLYITTSNRDGRGSAGEGDDKILRINPEKL